MSYLHAAVLGVVQGLSEFLPISSSGHLVLVPRLLGWQDQGLGFDAVMHLGTLAALLVYFRRELRNIVAGTDRRLGWLLVAATVPGGLAGLLFEKAIESRLRSPIVVAVSLIVWALVMLAADRYAGRHRRAIARPSDVGWGAGLAVGVSQALALIPGTSRSGITITTGLFAGMDRATAARFAFLLSIPITAGAGGLKTLHFLRRGWDPSVLGPLAVGMLASFLAGLAAVWFLVNFLQRGTLVPFVVYRCALGILILALFL
ncbi:MAG TPA: undecaprenyl-diphosphatase UppP [Methylomirabilota bacterium]|nr:undecaprenyl-diphosphatase UppP [Methylomirabilota bacterium]